MKRYKLLILLNLITVLFIAGCGGSENANVANQNTANAANIIVVNTTENNANIPNMNPPNMNAGTPVNPDVPGNAAIKKIPTDNLKPQLPSHQAPDNSEVSVALGENLVQTRVFKNHPQISKIESVTAFENGNEKKSIKVFMKNGQVRELTQGKVKDPMTEPADNILKALS